MKAIITLFAAIILVSFTSCKKDICCSEPANPVCMETVPENELCAAYFNRWFYDKQTNSCTQKGYSGCSAKGFATREECEACKCK